MTQYIKTVLEVNASKAAAGFREAERAAGGYEDKLDGLSQSINKSREDWNTLGDAALVAGGAMALGLGGTVKVAADFEQAMSAVSAVTDASASEMDALSAAALQAGEDTVFSATEAAEAQRELAKAGVSTADILGGALAGSLDLAAAGGLDLAESAEIAAQSMNLFSLEGQDVTHIADVLTAAANKSAAGVDDLGMALSQGGTVAASTGLTFEETAAALSAFADSGIKGSDAGTSLKTMLQRLNPSSKEAADEMKRLGISAYDAQGNFVGLDAFAGQLEEGMADLSVEQRNAAMQTIFGSDAVRAANILYKEGADGVREYTKAVDDQGAAARMSARMTDNLKGDVEELGGALETAFIKTGSGGTEGLRSITQGVEGVVSAYNDLPPAAQSAVFNIGAVSAAALIAGGATVKAVGFARDFDDALRAVGFSATTTKGRLAGLAKAAALPALGYAAVELRNYSTAGELADVTTSNLIDGFEELALGTEEASGGLADMFRQHDQGVSALFRSEEAFVSNAEAVERFGFLANEAMRTDWEGTVARWMEGTGAFDESVASADKALAKMVETGQRAAAQDAFENFLKDVDPENVEKVRAEFVLFQEALDNTGPAAGAVRAALEGVDDELDTNKDGWITATEEVEAHEKALEGVRNQLEQLGGGFRAERASLREFAQATKDAADAAKEGTFDEQAAALDGLAQAALDVASAQTEMGRGGDVIESTMASSRKAFIDAGVAAGRSREYMQGLADQMGLIPSEVRARVQTVGVVESTAKVLALDEQILSLDGKTVPVSEAGALAAKGNVLEFDGALFGLPSGKEVKVREVGSTAAGDKVVVFRDKVYSIPPTRTVDISANVTGLSGLAALEARVSALSGRRVEVAVGTYKAGAMWAGGINYRDDRPHPMAGGGLIGGGKQIAPGALSTGLYATSDAGIWMAEDPTVPYEAYITPREDVRAQNVATLATVADDFGYALTKMRSGGLTGSEHFSRHYTPTMPAVTVQAPAAIGPSHETTAIIENLHGVTPEVAVRWAERKQREANLSRRNTG